jgi:hypothetical protein
MIRPRPRTTVLGGIAIGLTAGVAVYSAISPSAVTTPPMAVTAFRVPKPPVTVTRVIPAPANPAPCATGSILKGGVCVVHVVRTVVIPASVTGSNPRSGQSVSGNGAAAGNSPTSHYSVSPGNGTKSGNRAMLSTSAKSSRGTTSGPRGAAPTAHATESGQHAAEQAHESAQHTAEQAHESAQHAAEQAHESAQHAAEQAHESAQHAGD